MVYSFKNRYTRHLGNISAPKGKNHIRQNVSVHKNKYNRCYKDNTFTTAVSEDHHSSQARENEPRLGDNDSLRYGGIPLILIS